MTVTSGSKRTRRRNPRGQGEKLREELLDAASAIMTADGNAKGLSLSSVARAVGIAATSVYLHFPDIEQLKYALVDRGFAEMNRRRAAATAELTDPAAVVLARWRAYAGFAVDNPGVYRLMFGPELPPVLAFDSPDSPGRQAFMSGVEAIATAQRAGAIGRSRRPVPARRPDLGGRPRAGLAPGRPAELPLAAARRNDRRHRAPPACYARKGTRGSNPNRLTLPSRP